MPDLVGRLFERRYSLRRRLLAVSLGAFLVLIALLAIGIWTYARTAANETYDLLLRGAAITMLERVTMTPEGIAVDLPTSAFEILALDDRDRVFYRVIDEEGRTLTGRETLPGGWLKEGLRPVQEPFFFDADYSGEPVRFVVNGRLLPGEAEPRWVGVEIGHTREARQTMQADLMLKGIVPLAALSLAGIALGRAGISLAMRPLAGIERDIRERQPLDLEPLKAEPPREIEALIAAINGFMRRLVQSRKQAETFIADVAHQTRTSLSMLQAHLEAADRGGQLDAENLAKAREQVGRTVRMTNQLLSHAMVIHRGDREMFEKVELKPLILRLLEEIVRNDRAERIEFGVDLPAGGPVPVVEGDAIAIREALRNLVDNALRHGPADNEITIGLSPVGAGAGSGDRPAAYDLRVEDRGPGVPEGEKARVVERFYSSGEKGGSGVGLAIVAAVAASHGGRFELRDAEPHGLVCVMRLPVVQSRDGGEGRGRSAGEGA
ncbi:sensor histidine kinase [Fulvimarina endophytica]|uniref:histidine kinase n=1 Tax=Fulvimarina endophytica TaxID=2293836 RepID=A0A371X4M2_9HYPH|nr:sensor histidine kinase [Fulvimarina endophytica]RFC64178.1 sensor histidine kinase [Fulvimarina endophytica]